MAKKKKKVPIKIWYTLDECVEVSGIGQHEIRDIIHKQNIKMDIRKGKFFIKKLEFDNYLTKI